MESQSIELHDIFDPLSHLPPGSLENPYPLLSTMRERAAIMWSPRGNQWLVLRYDEASSILRNGKFGKRLDRWKHPQFVMRQAMKIFRRGGSKSILLQDPPDHTRVRALVNSAFTPRVVHDLEDHIQEISDSLIEKMNRQGKVNLISEFAFPLPVTVIAELLGVPPEDRDRFGDWSRKITLGLDVSGHPARLINSIVAMEELRRYLSNTIKNKKSSLGSDLISSLITAQSDNNSCLSHEELLANTILILIAGHETTTNLIGNGVYNLLNYPDQKQLMLDDPNRISGAVEEILRFDPAVQLIRRIANEDQEVGGVNIRRNDGITILLGACNRDPLVFDRPDEFNIERESNRHLTFGAGIHFCLGAELARTEARVAFRQLFSRIPQLRLSGDAIVYKKPFGLRGPKSLFVRTN